MSGSERIRPVGRTVAAGLFWAALFVPPGSGEASAQGMPPEIAAQVRALGPVIDPPAIARIYRDAAAGQPTDGVVVTRDVPYGSDPREVLDVYRPSGGGDDRRPVFVFFHGGGFVRGDKADRANVGWYFARHGVVTVVPSYRLAPAARWPAGAQDVAAVATWVRDGIARFGGDPRQVTIGGESAGAAHVAAAALMPTLQGPGGLGARRIVLMSGVYDADLEFRARAAFGLPTPDPRNDAYFGADAGSLPAESTALHIGGQPVPVMLTYSELDPPQMQMQAGELFAGLCRSNWACPVLHEFLAHDHLSAPQSINTQDETVGRVLLDFVLHGPG